MEKENKKHNSNKYIQKKKKETSEDVDEPNALNSSTPVKNSKEESPICTPNLNINDIANYFKISHVSNELNLSIFKSLWYPDKCYEFPANKKQNLKFQFNWFSCGNG